jgi:hypothetical protein
MAAIHAALLAAGLRSGDTVVAARDLYGVTYSLLKDMTGLYATIFKKLSSVYEHVYTAVCQRMEIAWGGDDLIRFTFSGQAVAKGHTAPATTNGTGSGATALIVNDLDNLGPAAFGVVTIDGDDNGGAGYQITALDHSTETATISPAATWGDADAVAPFLPSPTLTTQAPIYGVDGAVSLDGGSTTVKFLSGSITLDTGVSLLNREYGDAVATDVLLGKRAVTVSLSMLVREDELYLQSLWDRKQSDNLRITLGDTAASLMRCNMTSVEMEPAAISTPETGESEVSVSGIAYGTSGEDELALVLV